MQLVGQENHYYYCLLFIHSYLFISVRLTLWSDAHVFIVQTDLFHLSPAEGLKSF